MRRSPAHATAKQAFHDRNRAIGDSVKRHKKMSDAKRSQHNEKREIAIAKGYFYTSGKKAGQPDLSRVMLEQTAEKEGISVATLLKRREEARLKRALEKLKEGKTKAGKR